MNFAIITQQLVSGMGSSLMIFVLTLLFSMPLGLLVAFGRMSKIKPLQAVIKVFIAILRGTPLMLQLLVVNFAPYYLFRISLPRWYRFAAIIIGFSINYAAYFAEIYRSGIESIPTGQYEAAQVLGYNKAQTFIRIILPQVIKRVLPSITNETITLVKDTSLAFTISIAEMFTVAKQIGAAQTSVMPLLAAGIFYYVFNLIVATVMEYIEKRRNVRSDSITRRRFLQLFPRWKKAGLQPGYARIP